MVARFLSTWKWGWLGFFLFATSAHAEYVGTAKLRLMPLLSTLGSSIAGERFNHSVMADIEWFVAPQVAFSLSGGHSRLSVGRSEESAAGVRTDEYIEEWQLGGLVTYYFTDDLAGGTFFTRAHFYTLFLNNERRASEPGSKVVPSNRAIESFALRAGPEMGYAFANGRMFFEATAGVSVYLKNPYAKFGGENEFGVPGWVTNLTFGMSDVYPTANASIGFLF